MNPIKAVLNGGNSVQDALGRQMYKLYDKGGDLLGFDDDKQNAAIMAAKKYRKTFEDEGLLNYDTVTKAEVAEIFNHVVPSYRLENKAQRAAFVLKDNVQANLYRNRPEVYENEKGDAKNNKVGFALRDEFGDDEESAMKKLTDMIMAKDESLHFKNKVQNLSNGGGVSDSAIIVYGTRPPEVAKANQLNDLYMLMLEGANKMGESFPGYINRHHKNELAQENYDIFMKKYDADRFNFENFEKDMDPVLLDAMKQQKSILNKIGKDSLRGISSGEYTRLSNGGEIDFRNFPRLDELPAIYTDPGKTLEDYLNTPSLGTIRPYEPSPLEKQRQGIASFIMKYAPEEGFGSSYKDPYYANKFAEDITFLSELIPGFGDVQGIREGDYMIEEGNPLAGGIMMGASMLPLIPGSAIARKVIKLQQKIKKGKFDEQRELRNAASGDGDAAYNAAEIARKKHQKAQRQLDEILAKEKAKPDLEPKVTPKEPPKVVQGELDLKPRQDLLFHGSQTRQLEKLELPKGQGTSEGGIYTLVNPTDPRFKHYAFGKPSRGGPGSGYVLQPNFEKTLDIDNMPDSVLNTLQNLEMYRGRPSRLHPEKLDFDLNTILRGDKYLGNYPTNINTELSDIFTKEGYDALRFPKRNMTGEAETIISLDPSKLDIVNEIPYEDLDDFIRTFLND